MKIKPAEILIKDYSYDLPPEKIAQFPLNERDSSKLLIYNNGKITENVFSNIAEVIPPESLLIFNDTKVINARLNFKNSAGKVIEIFTLEPAVSTDLASALQMKGAAEWICLVGKVKAWKEGRLESVITKENVTYRLFAELKSRQNDAFIVQFSWEPADVIFAEILDVFGVIPLPPYMKRAAVTDDNTRYQTVYAYSDGSVAAPTAGLHFTEKVMKSLKNNKIKTGFVTLHVGAGTFKPVKTDNIFDHLMHAESFYVELTLLKEIAASLGKNKIIAVGTTSMRTMESVYWFGVQLLEGRFSGSEIVVTQWEPYEAEPVEAADAIHAVIDHMESNSLKYIYGRTNIIIVPGYEFKIYSGIITNFHQPGSTLLLLIAAFIGNDWKMLYDYALKNDFRFLSYGDSSILLK